MQHVIFSDETRATLGGQNGWAKGQGTTAINDSVGSKQDGIWTVLVSNKGPVKVPEGVKITLAAYYKMVRAVFFLGEKMPHCFAA